MTEHLKYFWNNLNSFYTGYWASKKCWCLYLSKSNTLRYINERSRSLPFEKCVSSMYIFTYQSIPQKSITGVTIAFHFTLYTAYQE